MSRTLPLKTVQPKLDEFVEEMAPGDELVLTNDRRPVATITRSVGATWPCQPGSAQGRSFWMAPDFDAPLDDFAEHLG